MINHLSGIPIYIGYVEQHEEHLSLLQPFINSDDYWRTTDEWLSKTTSTIGHEKNKQLPWNEIFSDLEPHINDYFNVFNPTKQFSYKTTPWLNRYEQGDWQEQHNHIDPDAHFSMAYMLETQGQNNFVFADSPFNWYDDMVELSKIFANWPNRNFVPQQSNGTLLIWPCKVDHMVLPNKSDNYRITASSNFYIQETSE